MSASGAGGKGRYEHVEHGFAPVFDADSRVLVLGSFPSVKSREASFYYGNPQNRFWRVISEITGYRLPENPTIDDKKEMLLSCNIALWDVIASCDIAGSSDSSIRNVVPNDVPSLVRGSEVEAVLANGGTAARLYARHLEDEVGIPAVKLPSTSPANASWTLDRLIGAWKEALEPYLNG